MIFIDDVDFVVSLNVGFCNWIFGWFFNCDDFYLFGMVFDD